MYEFSALSVQRRKSSGPICHVAASVTGVNAAENVT